MFSDTYEIHLKYLKVIVISDTNNIKIYLKVHQMNSSFTKEFDDLIFQSFLRNTLELLYSVYVIIHYGFEFIKF